MLGGQEVFLGFVFCLWVEHRPCFLPVFGFGAGVGLGSCAFFFSFNLCVCFFFVRGGGGLILPTVDVMCGFMDNRYR